MQKERAWGWPQGIIWPSGGQDQICGSVQRSPLNVGGNREPLGDGTIETYVENGRQESNSRSIRLSFVSRTKKSSRFSGSSTKPSIDIPLLLRLLKKTLSGERLNTGSSYDKHRALPPDGLTVPGSPEDTLELVKVWWIAPISGWFRFP